MQNWIILSALAGLASNGFNITNRTALKNKGDSTAYAWWFEVVRTSFFFVILLMNPQITLTVKNILPLVLVGLSELFSVYVFMRMHALTELSISSVISRLRVVWSPLIAYFLLAERLYLYQYLGILAIFLGIAVVSSPSEIKRDRGIKIALLFSFSSALLGVMIKNASVFTSSELVIVSQGLLPIILLPLLMKHSLKRIVNVATMKFSSIITGGLFNIASSYFLVEALRLTDASKAIGLYQAMTILSVLWGIFILAEREKIYRKLMGAIIVILGILATIS
jgi:drug/metabolite transporter (DMT)-like permease